MLPLICWMLREGSFEVTEASSYSPGDPEPVNERLPQTFDLVFLPQADKQFFMK
ncbi:MAG: hypothetical protein RI973_1643 [Bacteroidota bacterium]|jgi:hypothetical protein